MYLLFIELACRRLLVPQKVHGEKSVNILRSDGAKRKGSSFSMGAIAFHYMLAEVPASNWLAIACGRLQHSGDRANLYRGRV